MLPASKQWPRKRPTIRYNENINGEPLEDSKATSDSGMSAISKSKSKFWSLISSLLRFSSKDSTESEQKGEQDSSEADEKTSFVIKRCASFAGNSNWPRPIYCIIQSIWIFILTLCFPFNCRSCARRQFVHRRRFTTK